MDPEEPKAREIPNAHAWQNDDSKVGLFFYACHENYKGYLGEKSDTVRLKLYAVYKQATVGDCNEEKPYDKQKREKWEAWMGFKGTSKIAAMRRYITLLRQLDPQLIVVEIHETPPSGFPTTSMGGGICARCNCKAGCLQPLLGSDPKNTPLEETLEKDQSLLSYEGLKHWMITEGKQLRCQHGAHMPITPGMAKPFEAWFDHAGCGGFQPYTRNNDSAMPKLVEKVLARNFRRAHQMELVSGGGGGGGGGGGRRKEIVNNVIDAVRRITHTPSCFLINSSSAPEGLPLRRARGAGDALPGHPQGLLRAHGALLQLHGALRPQHVPLQR